MPQEKQSLIDIKLRPSPFMSESTRNGLFEKLPDDSEAFPDTAKKVVTTAAQSLKRAENLIERVIDVREKNIEDPTQNELAARVNTFRFADRQAMEIATLTGEAKKAVKEHRDSIEQNVNRPITETASEHKFAAETREYLRNMPKDSDRMKFINNALENEQWDDLAVVLGAPHHLSGLTKHMQQVGLQGYKERRFGKSLKTLEALDHTYNILDRAETDAINQVNSLDGPSVQNAINRRKDAQSAMGDVGIKSYGG